MMKQNTVRLFTLCCYNCIIQIDIKHGWNNFANADTEVRRIAVRTHKEKVNALNDRAVTAMIHGSSCGHAYYQVVLPRIKAGPLVNRPSYLPMAPWPEC